MKSETYRSLFKDQSHKSLNKYKSETIEQRVNQISKDLLVGPARKQYEITTNTVKRDYPKPTEDLPRKIKQL
jgi:hypothetical protein